MWYVVQVRSGTEESICRQCERLLDPGVIERCFTSRYEKMKRYQGRWHKEIKILFPGYVFLSARGTEPLYFQLKKVIGLTKLIGTGDTVIPLTNEEEAFLRGLGGKDQIVAISRGVVENDQVIITEGPLKGFEGLIRKIDRHKKKAVLEIHMFGRLRRIEAGVEILRKTGEPG